MINTSYRYVKRPVKVVYESPTTIKSKRFKLFNFLPVVLCVMGIGILSYALYPYAMSYVQTDLVKVSRQKEILTPKGTDTNSVLGAAVGNSKSDPTSYYQNAASSISNLSTTIQKDHPEFANIKGEFRLTIEKINLKDLPTQINVESGFSDEYLEVLKSKLAHFKGSSIPGKPGNVFVYGHSARGSLFGNSWESIFTGLGDLDVGDIIKINYNGVEYKYSVTKWKTTSPNDTSVVLSTSDKQTLTLMTCWLPGIGNERRIVSADRIN